MIETDHHELFTLGIICGNCDDCAEEWYIFPCGSSHDDCAMCTTKKKFHMSYPSNTETYNHYLTDRKTDTTMTNNTYTPSQFPKGTRIRTQASSGTVTSVTGYGANLTVNYRSDNSKAPRVVKPNIHNSKFVTIIESVFTPVEGDRVDVSLNIPGITGSLRGTVISVYTPEHEYDDFTTVKADADGREYTFGTDHVTYKEVEPTWIEKLAAIKPLTVITHTTDDRGYAIKGHDGFWRNQEGVRMVPAENMWNI